MLFIISPYLFAGVGIYCLDGIKYTFDYKQIIHVKGAIVNEKCARIGPEICKKERIFMLFCLAIL